MNNKEKVKKNVKKINIVDVLIMVVSVMVIAAVITFVIALVTDADSWFGKSDDEKPNVSYTVLVSEVDTELYSIVKSENSVVGCPSLQVGDAVYERNSGEKIGVVSAITYKDSVRSTGAVDENNNLQYVPYPGYVDLYITVDVYCEPGKDANEVNGYEIRIGSELEFRTYGFYADGSIVNVGKLTPADDGEK